MKTVASLRTMWVLPLVVASLGLTARPAVADTIYTLGFTNAANLPAGPYGQVDVALIDGTHATVTLTAFSNSNNAFLFGDGGTLALNTNGTIDKAAAILSIVQTQPSVINGKPAVAGGPFTDGGTGNVDGLGS